MSVNYRLRKSFILIADFREEANKQYKRLVLGKEARLRNAYVIKAERVEKMQMVKSPRSSVLTILKL